MRRAVIVTFFAGLAAAAAWRAARGPTWPWALLLWPGLSGLLLAAAYAAGAPGLAGKRPDGRLAAWSWLLLLPYHALSWTSLLLGRALGGEAPCHEVAPGVWLGGRLLGREVAALDGVRAVLDLTCELPEHPALRARGYRCLPVLDALPPPPPLLREAVAWLEARRVEGPVYVHCALGHGRSATVVAAWLVATGRAPDAAAATTALRRVRPGVRLGAHQRVAIDALRGAA